MPPELYQLEHTWPLQSARYMFKVQKVHFTIFLTERREQIIVLKYKI